MNINDLSDTIVAKSDQLNADDLVGMEKIITITGVSRGNADNPVVIHYQGDDGRPFKPCLTVRRILIVAWGKEGNKWIGKQATLFCDPTVKYAGKEGGGIRIAALSDIAKPLNVKLSVTRGKKKEHIVKVMQPQQRNPWPDESFNAQFAKLSPAVSGGQMTAEQMITKFETRGELSDQQRKQIRDLDADNNPAAPDNLLDDGE